MAQDRKEYKKAWYQAHKEEVKARNKAWNQAHKEEQNARSKAYYKVHKEEYKAYYSNYNKVYRSSDLNSLGQTKHSIRIKSNKYLKKYGTKIPGFEIHHCCTYTEPYKFIYCSKEIHLKIHQYLRDTNIDADSDHYDLIKHLLDDTVVLYGL